MRARIRTESAWAAFAVSLVLLQATYTARAAEPSTAAAVPAGQVNWQVLGAGEDGTSIVVMVWDLGSCARRALDFTPTTTATSVAVKASIDASVANCNEVGSAIVAPIRNTYTIELGRPLKGQKISGQGRVLRRRIDGMTWSAFTGSSAAGKALQMPRLVGLAVPDAIRILEALGVPRRRIHVRGGSGGVVKQSIAPAGEFLPKRSSIVLSVGAS